MIKANELRVGNWVHVHDYATGKPNPTPEQVTAAIIKWISDIDTEVYPVNISPEVLAKAEFEFRNSANDYGWYFKLNKRFELQWCHGASVDLEDKEHESTFEIPSKFLHQLQNLYFALTGQELEIQL